MNMRNVNTEIVRKKKKKSERNDRKESGIKRMIVKTAEDGTQERNMNPN